MTFDLISTLASVLLSKSVVLAEGVLALLLLVALQLLISWASVRWERVPEIFKAVPALLLHRGRFLDAQMRAERITREEILSALREKGISEFSGVLAVVLETDGSLSVVRDGTTGSGTLVNIAADASIRHVEARLYGNPFRRPSFLPWPFSKLRAHWETGVFEPSRFGR